MGKKDPADKTPFYLDEAGIFGLSLATALNKRDYKVTVFDQNRYDESGYAPSFDSKVQAASVDHNKIFRASYGKKIHYQRLALEGRRGWESINDSLGDDDDGPLFVNSGMLRVQPDDHLGALERETLASMERDGVRHTQFVKSIPEDVERARHLGWSSKLLDVAIPDKSPSGKTFEAVLDSLAGFIRCSDACNYLLKRASADGVTFHLGPEEGCFQSLVEEDGDGSGDGRKAIGLRTKDGIFHRADVVVIAGSFANQPPPFSSPPPPPPPPPQPRSPRRGLTRKPFTSAGSFSTQLLPELAYHLESSAGSLATFKIDRSDEALWQKYSPEQFPVITWKSAPRRQDGTDTGSVYVLPRTPDGLVKIGYRGIKVPPLSPPSDAFLFTNFQPAPDGASFAQHGMWSVPLSPAESRRIHGDSVHAIRQFVSIFLPDFAKQEFHSTKMCWYTDSLDNSFLIDYVPRYSDKSVFVCTGGSGHGAKFLPVLGEHAADILEHGNESSSYMRPHWRWRDDIPRGNGLDEGPEGPRNIGNVTDPSANP
ncbi:FAD dependent oxidoreductase [Geosmithia morbida]|uniref:FAD dependent oxidoreductase n=1 Tax=Geosmithia morbida TaxID=1094350 RepID=A0A9P5D4A9_9HYPO|nr:FAD dependent oxidoreductase [Geosmithia morbida]KAF4121309.1 FAD dependent oxidoreductase [Geosmithia morbida]